VIYTTIRPIVYFIAEVLIDFELRRAFVDGFQVILQAVSISSLHHLRINPERSIFAPMKTNLSRVLLGGISSLLIFAGSATAQSSAPRASKGKIMNTTETATFASGCFWCTEEIFRQQPGVSEVISGYIGGSVDNPSYKQVCSGTTGHAEAIQITFDPDVISYDKLLNLFWKAHDPTQLNRQGADVGTQYRSAIFVHSPEQRSVAEASKKAADRSGYFKKPIVTEITDASTFYQAEDVHQDYYVNNKRAPYCRAVIRPKLKKLGLED